MPASRDFEFAYCEVISGLSVALKWRRVSRLRVNRVYLDRAISFDANTPRGLQIARRTSAGSIARIHTIKRSCTSEIISKWTAPYVQLSRFSVISIHGRMCASISARKVNSRLPFVDCSFTRERMKLRTVRCYVNEPHDYTHPMAADARLQ